MKKRHFNKNFFLIGLSLILFLGQLFLAKPVFAQVSNNPLSCEPRIFLVNSSYSLPYRYDGVEIKSGSSTVKPNDYLIYSVKVKNNLAPQRQIIQKIYIKHLLGANEPITVLDAQAVGGSCTLNNQDKSIFCSQNYSFVDEATDPIYILLKINNSIDNLPKTSSLFTIQTDTATTECASYLWLKEESKPNPINWSTPYASLNSKNFFIRIKDKKFYGQEPIRISSDPGVDRTTLEAIWQESGVEMRLFMYFQKKENNMWEMYELRTYNGESQGDWIYYKDSLGNKVESLLGYHNYQYERKFIPLDNQDAEIYCYQCSINAFLSKNQPPSEYGYILEPLIGLPEGKIITITNNPLTGYGVNVLLKNQNGEIVKDQRGINYNWKIANPNIAQIKPDKLESNSGCLYNIQPPCPLNHIDISGINPGKTEIKVSAIREADGLVLATASFPVLVISEKSLPNPELCSLAGEVIRKDQVSKCCDGLVLIPPTDDRTDIFGTCLRPCYKDEDCQEKEICSLTQSNQLVCVPGTRTTEEIGQIKEQIQELSQKQNQLQTLINKIVAFLKRVFGFKIY